MLRLQQCVPPVLNAHCCPFCKSLHMHICNAIATAQRRHVTKVFEIPAACLKSAAGRKLFSPGTKRKAAVLQNGRSASTDSSSSSPAEAEADGDQGQQSHCGPSLSPGSLFKKKGEDIFKALKNPYDSEDWNLYDTMMRSVFSLSREKPHHTVLSIARALLRLVVLCVPLSFPLYCPCVATRLLRLKWKPLFS